jgi:hypothetical protein
MVFRKLAILESPKSFKSQNLWLILELTATRHPKFRGEITMDGLMFGLWGWYFWSCFWDKKFEQFCHIKLQTKQKVFHRNNCSIKLSNYAWDSWSDECWGLIPKIGWIHGKCWIGWKGHMKTKLKESSPQDKTRITSWDHKIKFL